MEKYNLGAVKKKGEKYIFLIGPARSGTKIMRDVISTHVAIDKVPYDINYIWMYGHRDKKNDKLTAADFSLKSHNFTTNYLEKYRKNPENYLIEKSVSNTIRIPYLLQNYPEAKFIYLFRNGVDVIESVSRQWDKAPNINYLLKKAQTIPLKILFNYGIKFIKRNLHQHNREYFWGVDTPNLKLEKKWNDSIELIAHQWVYCIECMLKDSKLIEKKNLYTIRYEDLVQNPEIFLQEIIKFVNPAFNIKELNFTDLNKSNVGKGRQRMEPEKLQRIEPIIKNSMVKLNYEL